MTDQLMLRQLARQALMGAMLGTILALVLLVSNCQHLLDVVMGSSAPLIASAVFVAGLSLYSAFGATVTGLQLILQEGDLE
jgi:F0F1-type ATP synthase assembly protein I